MTTPLAYVWGDDDYGIEREVGRFADELASATGAPLERWDVKVERARAAAQVAGLGERLGTGVMFGGGTLSVAYNLGAAAPSKAGKDALIAMLDLIQPGNALAVVDLVESRRIMKVKGKVVPPQAALAEAIGKAGGLVRLCEAPKAANLVTRIATQAHERGVTLGPGAAKELAARIGGFVSQADAERRYQTRIASMELDKLALYRGQGPVTADDVRALVAETEPGTFFGLQDAIGERRAGLAMGLLETQLESQPEPVLIVIMHRRVRDLLETRAMVDAGADRASIIAAMHVHPFVAEKLEMQARAWTADELTSALAGLLTLDAMGKGVPGVAGDAAQRRLAFTMWILEHVPRRSRRTA